MKSTCSPRSRRTVKTAAAAKPSAHSGSPEPLTPFRWLVLLGFPPEVAAHILAPETFQQP